MALDGVMPRAILHSVQAIAVAQPKEHALPITLRTNTPLALARLPIVEPLVRPCLALHRATPLMAHALLRVTPLPALAHLVGKAQHAVLRRQHAQHAFTEPVPMLLWAAFVPAAIGRVLFAMSLCAQVIAMATGFAKPLTRPLAVAILAGAALTARPVFVSGANAAMVARALL
jgi:hypothetical protein